MKLTSIQKSLEIIEILGKHPRGVSLAKLSEETDLNKSSVHHILSTLIPYEYVTQDPETKKYSLGFKFLQMGHIAIENIDLRKIAHKHLLPLQGDCNETVQLAILRNGKVIYIDKIDKPDGLSIASYVGLSTDAHATGAGKALLSALTPQKIKQIYKSRALKAYSKNTITNIDKLLAELGRIRKQGYALDDEEYYEGVRSVAAPVRAGGEIVASITITGSIFTMSMERIKNELIRMVTGTAEKISSEMNVNSPLNRP